MCSYTSSESKQQTYKHTRTLPDKTYEHWLTDGVACWLTGDTMLRQPSDVTTPVPDALTEILLATASEEETR